jgi:hypothetical protein
MLVRVRLSRHPTQHMFALRCCLALSNMLAVHVLPSALKPCGGRRHRPPETLPQQDWPDLSSPRPRSIIHSPTNAPVSRLERVGQIRGPGRLGLSGGRRSRPAGGLSNERQRRSRPHAAQPPHHRTACTLHTSLIPFWAVNITLGRTRSANDPYRVFHNSPDQARSVLGIFLWRLTAHGRRMMCDVGGPD